MADDQSALGGIRPRLMSEEDTVNGDTLLTSKMIEPRVPLPPVPAERVPSLPLSTIMTAAIQKTYTDLLLMSELLVKKSEMDRKRNIVQFAHRTRQLFIRVLAAVKWAKSSDKVDTCSAITFLLDQHCALFVDTADRLSDLARNVLHQSRLPAFQIPAAVDVLTLGTYPRLPLCIKTHFVPEDPINSKEEGAIIRRLDQVVLQRLVSSSLPLPQRMQHVRVRRGMVTCCVPDEFEASLTLMGELANTPWHLLDLKILVKDSDLEVQGPLVHPYQLNYVHQLVQGRMNSADKPIEELYNVVHQFCQSLQLEILFLQAQRLSSERVSVSKSSTLAYNTITIDSYTRGRILVVSYWKSGKSSNDTKIMGLHYKLTISQNEKDQHQPFQVNHEPRLDGVRLPGLMDCEPLLNLEQLLTETILVRVRCRLVELQKRFINVPLNYHKSLLYGLDQKTGSTECVSRQVQHKCLAEIPTLSVDLLDGCTMSERLHISINVFTGEILCEINQLGRTKLVEDLENIISQAHWSKLSDRLNDTKIQLLIERCRKTASHLAVHTSTKIQLDPNAKLLNKLAQNCLYFKFTHYKNFYLVAEFKKCNQSVTNNVFDSVKIIYYLMNTRSVPANSVLVKGVKHSSNVTDKAAENIIEPTKPDHITSCEFLVPMSLTQFDGRVVGNKRKSGTKSTQPNITLRKRKLCDDSVDAGPIEPPEKVKKLSLIGYVTELSNVVCLCEQRIPFLLISDELTKRKVKFQPLHTEKDIDGPLLRILSVPPIKIDSLLNAAVDQDKSDDPQVKLAAVVRDHELKCVTHLNECLDVFWSTVLQCNVRLVNQRGPMSWHFELIMDKPPVYATDVPLADRSHLKCFTFSDHKFTRDSQANVVDAFLVKVNEWAALYSVVRDYAPIYHKIQSQFINVCQYRYHRLTLSYGPSYKYTLQLQYNNKARRYMLVFAVFGESYNPHQLMHLFFEDIINSDRSDALQYILQVMHETIQPLSSMCSGLRPDVKFINVNATEAYSSQFRIIPISEVMVRVMYRNTFIFEVVFLSSGYVAVRDVSKLVDPIVVGKQRIALAELMGFKAFFEKYRREDPSEIAAMQQELEKERNEVAIARQYSAPCSNDGAIMAAPPVVSKSQSAVGIVSSFSQPNTPASPLKFQNPGSNMQAPSPSMSFPLASPHSLIAPSPLGAALHSNGPGSVGPVMSGSQGHIPQPSSSFTAPSPAVNSPATQLQQLSSGLMTPSPATVPPLSSASIGGFPLTPSPGGGAVPFHQSPAAHPSPFGGRNPMGDTKDANVEFQSNWADAASCMNNSAPNSVHKPNLSDDDINLSADGVPILTSHATFCHLVRSPVEITLMRDDLSKMERYLGVVYTLYKMKDGQMIRHSDNMTNFDFKPGSVSFQCWNLVCTIYMNKSSLTELCCSIRSNDIHDQSGLNQEELGVLEKYFVEKVIGDRYLEDAIVAFLRVLSFNNKQMKDGVLRAFVMCMRYEMMMEQKQFRWYPAISWTYPPNSLLFPAVRNNNMVPGSPGIVLNSDKSRLLFVIKFTSAVQRQDSVMMALTYELVPNQQTIQIFSISPQSQSSRHVQALVDMINNQVNVSLSQGECSIWPVIQTIATQFILPS